MAPGMRYTFGIIFFLLSHLLLGARCEEDPAGQVSDDECLADGNASAACTLSALQRRSLKLTLAESGAAEAEMTEAEARIQAESEAMIEAAIREYSEHNNAAMSELGIRFSASDMSYNLMTAGPPENPLDYDGMAWPNLVVSGYPPYHIFAIGDWGGMDGAFEPGNGHKRVIVYAGGHKPGPHVFPRSRYNKDHSKMLCGHKDLVQCYATHGSNCPELCGYVPNVDDEAQRLVANAFNLRVANHKPKLILNVGDNFYYGGLEVDCGSPMTNSTVAQTHQFNSIFNGMYSGAAPWISTLGNHDWGGFIFTNGWDQQIAYTWKSGRWVMPASYYSQHVIFEDGGFTMDVFVVDSNHQDAKDPDSDPEHNVCSSKHNREDATCPGGPPSVFECKDWFHSRWGVQQSWLSQQLTKSKADWQVAMTHFPCGDDKAFWVQMHKDFGLDLLVTGHRHNQELWKPKRLGGLTCFVTGGGGGISSEASPRDDMKRYWYGEAQYGFYDLMISKDEIHIESVGWNGNTLKNAKVQPKACTACGGGPPAAGNNTNKNPEASCAKRGCNLGFEPHKPCQCNQKCQQYNSCCTDYQATCSRDATQGGGKKADENPEASCARRGCNLGFEPHKPCQCNQKCQQYNSCCTDYRATCARDATGGKKAGGNPEASCAKRGCNLGFEPHKPCQCNQKCQQYNSCCTDYQATCARDATGGKKAGGNPEASCAKRGCNLGFEPHKPCQCNQKCQQYNSCCTDYRATCSR